MIDLKNLKLIKKAKAKIFWKFTNITGDESIFPVYKSPDDNFVFSYTKKKGYFFLFDSSFTEKAVYKRKNWYHIPVSSVKSVSIYEYTFPNPNKKEGGHLYRIIYFFSDKNIESEDTIHFLFLGFNCWTPLNGTKLLPYRLDFPHYKDDPYLYIVENPMPQKIVAETNSTLIAYMDGEYKRIDKSHWEAMAISKAIKQKKGGISMINLKDLKLVKKVKARMLYDPDVNTERNYVLTSSCCGVSSLVSLPDPDKEDKEEEGRIHFIFEKEVVDEDGDALLTKIKSVRLYKTDNKDIYRFSSEEVQSEEEWHFILARKRWEEGYKTENIYYIGDIGCIKKCIIVLIKNPSPCQIVWDREKRKITIFDGKEYKVVCRSHYESILIAKAIKGETMHIPEIGIIEVKRKWIDENRVKTIATINGKVGETVKHPDDEDKPELGGAIAAIRALES